MPAGAPTVRAAALAGKVDYCELEPELDPAPEPELDPLPDMPPPDMPELEPVPDMPELESELPLPEG
jgi:hypothetical protein